MLLKFLILVVFSASVSVAGDQLVSNDVDNMKFFYYPTVTKKIEILYDNLLSLILSGFKSNCETKVIVDGMLSNSTSPMSLAMMNTFVSNAGSSCQNVIVVDWGALSGGNYWKYGLTATEALLTLGPYVGPNVKPCGQRIAKFLSFLRLFKNIEPSKIHIIGHSLGSHIVGEAASYSKRHLLANLNRVTGLDPARQTLFPTSLIHQGEARFVELYHTNRLGFGDNETTLGDFDVFVNGGTAQPNCFLPEPILAAYCSHSYSWELYAVSITNPLVSGCPCVGPYCFCDKYLGQNCAPVEACNPRVPLGYHASSKDRGEFHIST